ncbi:MAG: hypothetical protein O7C98_03375 [Planctomycetota bacterium]|nr:hypothetical protein [Planctomycetota bacterium]
METPMRDSNKSSAFLRILPALLVAALLVPGCVVRPVVHHPRHKKVVVHRPHKTVVVHEHEKVVVHRHQTGQNVTVVNVKGPNGEVTSVTNGKTKVVTVKDKEGNSVTTVTKVKGKKKGHKKHDDD